MDTNNESLLDLGDDTPSLIPHTTEAHTDASDSLASIQLSSEPLVPSSAPVSADLFDPLTPVTMSTGTEQNTTYEAEFADLMGDMDGTQEPQNTSADLDGQPMLDPITVHTEQEDENHIEADESDSSQAAPSENKELMKGVDVMKARYEGKEEMQKIPLRRPKKLDRPWGKQTDESDQTGKTGSHTLPREQDIVPYSILGTDYGRKQYETKVEKERAQKDGQLSPIPVNRQVVEKVAPPEITKNIRHMFETGQLTDLHPTKKTQIEEPTPESGVYENKPVQLEGIVRSADFNMEGEELQKGFTKNLLDEWKNKGNEDEVKELQQINVAEDEGKTLENEPEVRTDVTRESDIHPADELTINKGHAQKLKEQFLRPKEGPKERKVIKLVENEEAATVFENTPELLEGVVRSSDQMESTKFERGKAKNLKGYWATRTDEVDVKKEPIKLHSGDVGPAVLESQPEVLEGVVRGSDLHNDEKEINLKTGHTRNIASMWQQRGDDDTPKLPKQPIKMDLAESGPTVLENDPVVLEDVVKCDTIVEDVIPGNRGRTKDIAGKFLACEERDNRPRQQIVIERGEGPTVTENEPSAPPEGVMRSDSYQPDTDILESGRTKNLLDHWGNKEQDNLTPKNSYSSSDGKPSWIKEIEAARDSGVFENEPEVNMDVVKETDIPECEKVALIPDNATKELKNMWLHKAEEEELAHSNKHAPELVRFTPPREITPPPVNQTEYQSIQSITLAPKMNGHVNGLDYEPAEQPQGSHDMPQKSHDIEQGSHDMPKVYQNGVESEAAYSHLPAQTVKSSTVLVLK